MKKEEDYLRAKLAVVCVLPNFIRQSQHAHRREIFSFLVLLLSFFVTRCFVTRIVGFGPTWLLLLACGGSRFTVGRSSEDIGFQTK